MTAGPYTILAGVTLSGTEEQSGYSSRATDGGPDTEGLLEGAKQDLLAAQEKLTTIVAALPSGANKTAIQGQLTLLEATS
ncbi:MAG: hypothetical protein ACREUT_20380 [Steroidobacteraceae bacterium]